MYYPLPLEQVKQAYVKAFTARYRSCTFCICYDSEKTSREVEGKDYQFLSIQEFESRINKSQFLEYAKVFGNYYGTPAQLVERTLKSGVDVLFDIDWQGTQQLKARARQDLVSVFILPPSIKELEKRLFKRAQDTSEVVANRMSKSASEMSHYLNMIM